MIREETNGLTIILLAIFDFIKPALVATVLLVVGMGLLFGIGSSIHDNWGDIVCWENDETGRLSRTCALHKIAESNGFKAAEVTEITGIAEISENVKRVEFKWRFKPNPQSQNPQVTDATVTFRKYDDGWRPSE